MEELSKILDYAITLGPSIVSVASLVASIIYVFRKTGSISQETVGKVNNLANEIKGSNEDLKKENTALKAENKALYRKVEETNAKLDEILEKTSFVRKC